MHQRGVRPDVIIMADTGSEKPETYAYLPVIEEWLARVGFPVITTVRNARPKTGDASLGAALTRLSVLPALAFGAHQCSLVWKIAPQETYLRKLYGWSGKEATWSNGVPHIEKIIGYSASPRDRVRAGKAHGKDSPGFQNRYFLIDWNITREDCEALILAEGLPLPTKSSCFFCPAMKREEVDQLATSSPDLLRAALLIEDRAIARGLKTVRGLGRSWRWRDYVEGKRLLEISAATENAQEQIPA